MHVTPAAACLAHRRGPCRFANWPHTRRVGGGGLKEEAARSDRQVADFLSQGIDMGSSSRQPHDQWVFEATLRDLNAS